MNPNFERIMSKVTHLAQNAARKVLASTSQPNDDGGEPSPDRLPAIAKNPAKPINNPAFQNSMGTANRLIQEGDLQAATAVIQAALAGATTRADLDNDLNVIDVEARESGGTTPEAKTPNQPVQPSLVGQFTSGSHTEGSAGMREYKLYIPPASFTEPLPLVVMLHGCTQNPDDFAAGTCMNDAALERGFYVLYPAQTQHANSSRCWNWFKHNHQKRGRGEPALLAGMTREVMSRYNIDPQRVYVAGLSAGGAMAAILGDTYPDLFAAVGVHSGLATGSATNLQSALSVMQTGAAPDSPTRPSPPTIVFHGDKDSTVNPANGEHVITASAGALKAEQKRARGKNGRDCTHRVYKEDSGRVVAEHWTVHGAGHAWSGGSAQGSYTDSQGPDASGEMLRFFLANTLDANPSNLH